MFRYFKIVGMLLESERRVSQENKRYKESFLLALLKR